MEPKEANILLEKIEQEIRDFLKVKGYKVGGSTSYTTISSLQEEFRVQTKEIGFIITIKAVKPYLG